MHKIFILTDNPKEKKVFCVWKYPCKFTNKLYIFKTKTDEWNFKIDMWFGKKESIRWQKQESILEINVTFNYWLYLS